MLHEMTGMKRFELLHEMGHVQLEGFLISLADDQLHVYYLCAPMLGLLMRWTTHNAIVCGTLIVLIGIVAPVFHRWLRKISRVFDEVYADIYALERCPLSWLGDYPSSELAAEFCTDQNLPADYNRLRRELFERNVERVRSGEEPGYDEIGKLPKMGIMQGVGWIEDLLVVTLVAYIGFHLADLTLWRLLIGAPLMYLISVLAICAVIFTNFLAERIDASLGVGTLSANSQFFIESAKRALQWDVAVHNKYVQSKRKFANWGQVGSKSTLAGAHQAKSDDERNKGVGKDLEGRITAKPADVMFLPQELDIYCNRATLDAYNRLL
jgi:hypothetical protein